MVKAKITAVDTPGDGSIKVTVEYKRGASVLATREHNFGAGITNDEILENIAQNGLSPIEAEVNRGGPLQALVNREVDIDE